MRSGYLPVIFLLSAAVLLNSPQYVFSADTAKPASKDAVNISKEAAGKGPDDGAFMKELNLTDKQNADLKQYRADLSDKMKSLRETIRQKEALLKTEIDKADMDKAKVDKIASEIKDLNNKIFDMRIERIMYLKKTLTPEQYSRLREAMDKMVRGRLKGVSGAAAKDMKKEPVKK